MAIVTPCATAINSTLRSTSARNRRHLCASRREEKREGRNSAKGLSAPLFLRVGVHVNFYDNACPCYGVSEDGLQIPFVAGAFCDAVHRLHLDGLFVCCSLCSIPVLISLSMWIHSLRRIAPSFAIDDGRFAPSVYLWVDPTPLRTIVTGHGDGDAKHSSASASTTAKANHR